VTHAGHFRVRLAVEPPILKCLAILQIEIVVVVHELDAGANCRAAIA